MCVYAGSCVCLCRCALLRLCVQSVCACMSVRVYECVSECMSLLVSVLMCVCICVCACVCTCMCAYIGGNKYLPTIAIQYLAFQYSVKRSPE